jgi:hypothetical protein
MRTSSITALLAGLFVASCGAESSGDQQTKTAPAAAASQNSTVKKDSSAQIPLGPVPSMPAANGKPAADTPEQRAHDLVACESGKAGLAPGAKLPADVFDKALARVKANPGAVDACRAR